MANKTNQRDHWILDTEYSNYNDESKEKQIVLDSINSIVFKNKELKELKKEKTNYIDFDEDYVIDKIPKINFKQISAYKNYISRSQNWIGHVLKVDNDSFFAKLEDKNEPTTYETASFDIEEVSTGDLDLLKVGASFYWSVGYANQNGQVIKQSLVRFKRAVNIIEEEFEEIAGKVDDLYNDLNWD